MNSTAKDSLSGKDRCKVAHPAIYRSASRLKADRVMVPGAPRVVPLRGLPSFIKQCS